MPSLIFKELIKMKKIFMMGDSTMKYNNIFRYPQVGWGQVLHLFAKNDWLKTMQKMAVVRKALGTKAGLM